MKVSFTLSATTQKNFIRKISYSLNHYNLSYFKKLLIFSLIQPLFAAYFEPDHIIGTALQLKVSYFEEVKT